MDLIKTTTEMIGTEQQQAVNARELWAFLKIGRDFSNWIRSRIKEYGFVEGIDYSPVLASKAGRGGYNRIDYYITLDMAKELAMVENNERGRQARQYFIEVEKRYRMSSPQTMADAIIDRVEKRISTYAEVIASQSVELRYLRQFAPNGNPGEVSRETGRRKTRYRRGYWTSDEKARPIGLLATQPQLPGMAARIPENTK